jgi:hypothetical protein
MHVGATFRRMGQSYECTGRFETIVPAKCVMIYRLKSRCPDCGESFACTGTASSIDKHQIARRCPDCRKPGVPISTVKATKHARGRKSKGRRKARRWPIDAPRPATSHSNAAIGPTHGVQGAPTAAPSASASQAPSLSVAPIVADTSPSHAAIEHATMADAYRELLG